MIEEKLVTPPIRAALMEESGHEPNAKTPTRDWWLHWNSVTLRGNQNAADIDTLETLGAGMASDIAAIDGVVGRLLRTGTHAMRLAAAPDPAGALWMESDRSDVIYQVHRSGAPVWAYITGTMYGTLSPDQRPADLVASDAGFEFRSTDSDPVYGGRHFIWSGALWVEVTPARWGAHAARVAATPHPASILWIETDRGNVIYQAQGVSGVEKWIYVAGSMFALLADQPADLGVDDAGFQFFAADTGQAFHWDGAAWVGTSGTQTPWTSNIDGATFQLTNVGLVDVISEYRVAGQRVVGARSSTIPLPTGGTVIDAQARNAIIQVIQALSAASGGHGLIA